MPNTKKARFRLAGIYCVACKPLVEMQLKGSPNKKIDIDFMTDSALVEYDTALITKRR